MKPAHTLPQFQFLGKLGTGGTAQVHKVLTNSNKIAALKTILQSEIITTDEFKKLALREKTLLRNIDFPGIVKVYEVQTEEPCYICLEYCSGKTLETYIKIEHLQTALNIISAIAVNMEFLHLKSIVHADLKPDNIFMPEDISVFASDKLTFLKLSDFSLGKFDHEDNSVRAGVGTVGYMAPETIRDNIVTHQSDLFALGVIAYQILTGQHPFILDDTDPLKINCRVLEDQPIQIQELRNDISDDVALIISTLLERDSSKRVQSAWEVCKMLQDAGATYPFEKVLQPKYAIDNNSSYNTNKKQIAITNSRLDTISNKNNKQLRLVLSYNFQRENIYYSEKQFHFKSSPLIAPYLIRQSLKSFFALPFSEKKSVIELSLAGKEHNLISTLLPHLLKPQTIIKTAKKLASVAESDNKYYVAANLYVQSGDLLKAESAAYQAAMRYKNENKIDSALELLNKVISYGTLLNRKFEIKSLLMVKGDLLKDIGEADKAETVYYELIELYKDKTDDELLAETHKDLGDLYKMKRNSEKGIISLEKALDIYKKLGNELEVSKTYNNLGTIYTVKNDFKISLSYFRKALRIQRKLSADEETASTLNNIAVLYGMTNKFKKALKIFTISLSINKELGNKGETARTLNNIGYCYDVLGNAQNAVEVLHDAMRYNNEIESKGELLFNLENLTVIMYSTGQLKESITYLKEGINLATELNDKPHIAIFNLYLGAVFVRLGKLKEGYKSFANAEKILNTIEDKYLLALLYIEKAQSAILINSKTASLNSLNLAQSIYDKIKDKIILIKILLLQLTLTKNLTLVPEVEKIITNLELTKEPSILLAHKINYYLTLDNSYDVQDVYVKLLESVQASNEHIEQCSLLTTLAKYELHQDNIDQAIIFINQSIQLAKSRGLVFDHFHALVLSGKIFSRQKNVEKCYSVYKQAFQIAKNIFNQLESDTDKESFQNKEEFIFLVSEIKKLSQIVGQKKEQMA